MRLRFLCLLLVPLLLLGLQGCRVDTADHDEILRRSWAGYKTAFIREGRVVRPRNGYDTVSEGQAYAMLRAMSAGDRETFDDVLAWTEEQLSRFSGHGDHLLAWHYVDGRLADATPASDADIDYAYALLRAGQKWNDPSYTRLAEKVMADILAHETLLFAGKRWLLPWPVEEWDGQAPLPQNPSYYSPSSFKVFYAHSGDSRWLELAATGYDLVEGLQERMGEKEGVGLVPDWCGIDAEGRAVPLPGFSDRYGWDALRVPMRIGFDHLIFHEPRAEAVLRRFSHFFDEQYTRFGHLHSGYRYGGKEADRRENPLFDAAAFFALQASGSPHAARSLERVRRALRLRKKVYFYYLGKKEYYANSLCWLPEYYLHIEQLQHDELHAP